MHTERVAYPLPRRISRAVSVGGPLHPGQLRSLTGRGCYAGYGGQRGAREATTKCIAPLLRCQFRSCRISDHPQIGGATRMRHTLSGRDGALAVIISARYVWWGVFAGTRSRYREQAAPTAHARGGTDTPPHRLSQCTWGVTSNALCIRAPPGRTSSACTARGAVAVSGGFPVPQRGEFGRYVQRSTLPGCSATRRSSTIPYTMIHRSTA